MLLFTDFSKYLVFLQISELALMKQPKNSLQLPKSTRNTRNKTKRSKIYFAHNKENNIHNIVPVLVFQQLLATKDYKLRDSKSRSGVAEGRCAFWLHSLHSLGLVWFVIEGKNTRERSFPDLSNEYKFPYVPRWICSEKKKRFLTSPGVLFFSQENFWDQLLVIMTIASGEVNAILLITELRCPRQVLTRSLLWSNSVMFYAY